MQRAMSGVIRSIVRTALMAFALLREIPVEIISPNGAVV